MRQWGSDKDVRGLDRSTIYIVVHCGPALGHEEETQGAGPPGVTRTVRILQTTVSSSSKVWGVGHNPMQKGKKYVPHSAIIEGKTAGSDDSFVCFEQQDFLSCRPF